MPKICRTGYEAVREDGAFTMSEGLFTEEDWKLFRKKLPEWQENYMGELIKEYAAILADKGEAWKYAYGGTRKRLPYYWRT